MNCFITGTDTEIGKTAVSCALLHGLRERGHRASGMKPVAAGARADADGHWRNDDAERLLAESAAGVTYADVNPIVFSASTAPNIASVAAGLPVDLARVRSAYERCVRASDVVVVEGIGGWRVPLGPGLLLPELVRDLELPVILVAGIRLGAINHALLSAAAIVGDRCRLLGWIANVVDPGYAYAAEACATIEEFIAAPCLGVVAWQSRPSAATMAPELTRAVDVLTRPAAIAE